MATIAVKYERGLVLTTGQENPGAFELVRKLKSKGHKVILLTRLEGQDLNDALEYLEDHDASPDHVNALPGSEGHVFADFLIDPDAISTRLRLVSKTLVIDLVAVEGFLAVNNII